MRRALAKPHPRLIGIDDGAFRRDQPWAPLVAVAVSLPGYVEGVARGRVRVDGTDATERIAGLVRDSGHLEGARAILVDGIAFGGFNLLDLKALSQSLGLPVISVTRKRPDFDALRTAIFRYFPGDARHRWRLLRAQKLFPVSVGESKVLASVVGARRSDAATLIARATIRGSWPEALRLAHFVARALGRPPARTFKGPTRHRRGGPVA